MNAGKICEWCGHAHDVRALCSKRPTWGRRGFLKLAGAALVGAVVAPEAIVAAPETAIKFSPWEDVASASGWIIYRPSTRAVLASGPMTKSIPGTLYDADVEKLFDVVREKFDIALEFKK